MLIGLTKMDGTRFMLNIALIIVMEERDGKTDIAFQTRDSIQKVTVQEDYNTIRDKLDDLYM